MNTPKKLKLGAQDWTVVERRRSEDGMLDDGSYGYTLPNHNLIVIDADMPPSKKRVTLLHEVLHATRLQADPPQTPSREANLDEWEHFFIAVWDNALVAALRDNPRLVEWLTGGDQK